MITFWDDFDARRFWTFVQLIAVEGLHFGQMYQTLDMLHSIVHDMHPTMMWLGLWTIRAFEICSHYAFLAMRFVTVNTSISPQRFI